MNGWIKFYRDLLDKPIWSESNPEQKTVLVTLLLMANNKTKEWEWHGESYKADPGQFVTSLQGIADKCGKGITTQNVRTALKRFEKYEFLTNESTNKNRLITIVNWAKYQGTNSVTNKQPNKQLTSNQQATNKQLTTNEELKNLRTKELKNKDNVEQQSYDQLKGQVHEVVSYLNSQTSKHFKASSKDTDKLVRARLHEGYTIDDFKKVIDVKAKQWLGTSMDQFLRPGTLFTASHFESYLNEKPVTISISSNKRQVKETLPGWAKHDKSYQAKPTQLSAEQQAELDKKLAALKQPEH